MALLGLVVADSTKNTGGLLLVVNVSLILRTTLLAWSIDYSYPLATDTMLCAGKINQGLPDQARSTRFE